MDDVKQIILGGMLPEWMSGDFPDDSMQAKSKRLLSEMNSRLLDEIFAILEKNNLYIVGGGAKAPKPELPAVAEPFWIDPADPGDCAVDPDDPVALCRNPDHYELRA